MLKVDDIPERLFDQIAFEPNTGCWLWYGNNDGQGYGRLHGYGREQQAHRVFWILANGPIPDDKPQVLHHCDVRCCVNPDHLFVGTNADNMADRNRKGRQARLRGERHPMAKLTEVQVIAVRKVYATGKYRQSQIAKLLGVSQAQIRDIVIGKRWRHLLPTAEKE